MSGVSLRDYQDEALCRMKKGCILNGDVGSGKSRTALAYYYTMNGGKVTYYCQNEITGEYDVGPYEHGTNKKIKTPVEYVPMRYPVDLYIITTARKRDTKEWEEELKLFRLSTDNEKNSYKNKVVVDSWNNIEKYHSVTNAFFIFDEQRVVGYGVWSKVFIHLAKSNDWILLSATPGDKWEDFIPVFIANGFYKNKTDFCNKHAVWSRFTTFPKIEKYINEGHLLKLKQSILVDMHFVRETVQHHENIICNYDKEKYNYVAKTKWNIIKDKPIENANEYCQVLRQIVNSDNDRKIKCMDIVQNHPKAIIFYNLNYELDILRNLFENYPNAEWNGFKHEPIPTGDSWVYLVQYIAGNEGWNCTKTDTIIFYSQSYSYRVMKQASGRIDRLNTPYKNLYYYHLYSESKLDREIMLNLKRKKRFNELKFAPEFKKMEGEKKDEKNIY